MEIGHCECSVGIDGSPCWHQFILWSHGFSCCPNFLQRFDKKKIRRNRNWFIFRIAFLSSPVSSDEIQKLLQQLNPRKTIGGDKISPALITIAAEP